MKTDKHYVSEIDKKLAEFDQTHPKSESQKNEIRKHQRVFELRDHPKMPTSQRKSLLDDDY